MSESEREKWNASYRKACDNPRASGPPAEIVGWVKDLLAPSSRVLDLGAGLLRNARPLADAGHRVLAIDIAEEAFVAAGVDRDGIETRVADLDEIELEEGAFDLVLDVHYLNRGLAPAIVMALRPGGLLALEIRLVLPEPGAAEPRFRLRPSEAMGLFPGLKLLRFVEMADKEEGVGRYLFQKVG